MTNLSCRFLACCITLGTLSLAACGDDSADDSAAADGGLGAGRGGDDPHPSDRDAGGGSGGEAGTGGRSSGNSGSGGSTDEPGDAGNGGSGGSGGSGPASPSGLVVGADPSAPINSAVRAICRRIKDCNAAPFAAITAEECEQYLAQPCRGWGLITEADGLEACTTAIEGWECDDDDDNQVEEHCADGAVELAVARAAGVLVQGEDEPCGEDDRCAYGYACSGSEVQCGTCVPVLLPGDACVHDETNDVYVCGENQYCDADMICRQEGGLRDDCSDDTHCRSNQCLEGKCAFMIPDGEECARGEYCASGHCENDVCVSEGTDNTSGANGDSCTAGSDCDSNRCAAGTCQAQVPLGGECEGTIDCDEGGSCVDGTCVLVASCAEGGEGDPCPAVGCAAGLVCDDATGRCRAGDTLAIGAGCVDDLECASGYCAGTCQLRPPMSLCGSDAVCESGTCNQSICTVEGASQCQ